MIDPQPATAADLAALRALFVGMEADFGFEDALSPGWLPMYGQVVSISAYPLLFAKYGTLYGGDGSSTFGIPDARGRYAAAKDDMGGTAAGRLTNGTGRVNGLVLGAVGGGQTVSLSVDQMPAHNHAVSIASAGAHTHPIARSTSAGTGPGIGYQFTPAIDNLGNTGSAGAHTHTVTESNRGSSAAHPNIPPTRIVVRCVLAF